MGRWSQTHYWFVDMADARPTDGQRERYLDLKEELRVILSGLQTFMDTDLAAFNDRVREMGVAPVILSKGKE